MDQLPPSGQCARNSLVNLGLSGRMWDLADSEIYLHLWEKREDFNDALTLFVPAHGRDGFRSRGCDSVQCACLVVAQTHSRRGSAGSCCLLLPATRTGGCLLSRSGTRAGGVLLLFGSRAGLCSCFRLCHAGAGNPSRSVTDLSSFRRTGDGTAPRERDLANTRFLPTGAARPPLAGKKMNRKPFMTMDRYWFLTWTMYGTW